MSGSILSFPLVHLHGVDEEKLDVHFLFGSCGTILFLPFFVGVCAIEQNSSLQTFVLFKLMFTATILSAFTK